MEALQISQTNSEGHNPVKVETPNDILWNYLKKFKTCVSNYHIKEQEGNSNEDLLCSQQNYTAMKYKINNMVTAYLERHKIIDEFFVEKPVLINTIENLKTECTDFSAKGKALVGQLDSESNLVLRKKLEEKIDTMRTKFKEMSNNLYLKYAIYNIKYASDCRDALFP